MKRFEASSDTRFLAQELSQAKPGDTITYDSLSTAIGRDVRVHARGALFSALRMQLHDRRVFEAVPNVGYRLLTAEEIVRTQAAKGMQRIARTARVAGKKVASAEYDELTEQDKVAHNTQLSILGAISQMTKPVVAREIESKVRAKGAELALGETLRYLTNGKRD